MFLINKKHFKTKLDILQNLDDGMRELSTLSSECKLVLEICILIKPVFLSSSQFADLILLIIWSQISAVARIRNALAYATHTFFQKHGFLYIHTPIITTSDCEGAGEMFQVTTLISEAEKLEKELVKNPSPSEAEIEAAKLIVKEKGEAVAQLKTAKASKEDITAAVAVLTKAKENLSRLEERFKLKPGIPQKDGKIDYGMDFFARQAFLTVSGQLQVETFACAVSSVYTFGPTFRAEQSHTSRHLAEFWMIEPEIAFADLKVKLGMDIYLVSLEVKTFEMCQIHFICWFLCVVGLRQF